MKTEFILTHTIYEPHQMGEFTRSQIPLAGRSNVGKSSLINSLAGQKKLAKTSSQPGKTRSVNFYLIPRYKFYLVDLPGYGYARASKKEREKWASLVDSYFEKNRAHIKAIILLIDSRIPPQDTDISLANYLQEKGIKIFPLLTKADKARMSQKNNLQSFWKNFLSLESNPLLFSARTSLNKDILWEALLKMVRE